MNDLRKYKSTIILKCLIGNLIIVGVLFFLAKESMNFISLIMGTIISVFNFSLLSKDIAKMPNLEKRGFASLMIIRFFMRYVMIALAMFVALKYEMNIILFIIGLFSVQLTLIADNFIKLRQVA